MKSRVGNEKSIFSLKARLITLQLFLVFTWIQPACATELVGKVVGDGGLPKTYVSVSIFGAVNRRTQTNSDGTFTVDLPPGSYIIRIRQDPNRKEFKYEMTADAQKADVEFKVDW